VPAGLRGIPHEEFAANWPKMVVATFITSSVRLAKQDRRLPPVPAAMLGCLSVAVGATVSTVKDGSGGVGSSLPAASRVRTEMV
jgi:hypothetical protein